MSLTIYDLKVGQSAIIKQFFDLDATCKLISMGFIPNARIEVVRKVPFGGALYIKVDNQFIAMRRSEAQNVEIVLV